MTFKYYSTKPPLCVCYLCSGMTSFVKKWLMERTSFWRFHPDSTMPLFIPRPMQNKCSTCCHRIITETDTVLCSYGAYFMMLKWSLFYIAQLEPILCLWHYDIFMDFYYSKDTFMDVTIYIDTIWYFYDMLWYKNISMAYAIALNYCILYVLKLVNDTVPTWTIWAKSVLCVLRTQGEC